MSKVMGIFVKFWPFLRRPLTKYSHLTRPKKKISIFVILFVLILHLILGKVTKFPVEKLSTSQVISRKTHGGWKTSPSAFRVNTNQYGGHYGPPIVFLSISGTT